MNEKLKVFLIMCGGAIAGILLLGLVIGPHFGIGFAQLPQLEEIKANCPEVLDDEYRMEYCINCNPDDYTNISACEILCKNGLPRCEPCLTGEC